MSIRAFKQILKVGAKLPGGGAVYKFDLDTAELKDYFPIESRQGFKFFVTGEYASPVGGSIAVHCYTYFYLNEWYLYNNSVVNPPDFLAVSVIAVPPGLSHDMYAKAYFSHEATPVNTRQQAGDQETPNEYQYLTYLNEPALYAEGIEESRKLMLIVSRYIEVGDTLLDPMPDLHPYSVWFDPHLKKWAIVYPSRNSILPGTRFHVMAMDHCTVEEMKEEVPLGGYHTAFAFEHQVGSTTTIPSAINTSLLEKEKAELLLELLPSELKKEPHQLVVIATERLDDDGLLTYFEPWKGLRLRTDINLAALCVWYINDNAYSSAPLWSILTVSNIPIKPTTLNICTRLPCPTYCGKIPPTDG